MDHDMTIHPDPARVFADAIEAGFLSRDPDSPVFAGLWMYMFHDSEGRAHFKHIETRHYRVMPASPQAMTGGER